MPYRPRGGATSDTPQLTESGAKAEIRQEKEASPTLFRLQNPQREVAPYSRRSETLAVSTVLVRECRKLYTIAGPARRPSLVAARRGAWRLLPPEQVRAE